MTLKRNSRLLQIKPFSLNFSACLETNFTNIYPFTLRHPAYWPFVKAVVSKRSKLVTQLCGDDNSQVILED